MVTLDNTKSPLGLNHSQISRDFTARSQHQIAITYRPQPLGDDQKPILFNKNKKLSSETGNGGGQSKYDKSSEKLNMLRSMDLQQLMTITDGLVNGK